MMENSLWIKHIIRYGAILGFSLSLIEFFALYMGLTFNSYIPFIYIIFTEMILMITIKRHRDNNLGGVIKFLDAFLTGLFVSLLAGLIWSVYRYIQYILVPGILEEYVNEIISGVQDSNLTDSQKEFYSETYRTFVTPGIMAFFITFFFNMGVGGSILSLFLASILKRKPLNIKPE